MSAGEFVEKLFYFPRHSCYTIFTYRDATVEHQQVFRTADRPFDVIQKMWEKSYRIREVTYASNVWITVGEQVKGQSEVNQDIAFEAKWDITLGKIGRCIDEGKRIQFLHYVAGQWVIIMDKTPASPKPEQKFHMFETGFPHEFLNEDVWGCNRMVTQCTYGDKMWIVLTEPIPKRVEVIQGMMLKNMPVSGNNVFPLAAMQELITGGRFIRFIAYDDADRSYGIIYERNANLAKQGLIVNPLFPQDNLHAMGVL